MEHQTDARKIDALQARVGHFFKDRAILIRALTHPTAALEAGWTVEASYERMEFLGDSLLNAWVAELLFDRFPHEPEGVLTKLRAHWVSGAVLARLSRELGLPACVLLGEGGKRDRIVEQERVQASVLESFLAALYLDGGVRKGKGLVKRLWDDPVMRRGLEVLKEDAKTALQELRQAEGLSLPVYTSREGEAGGFLAEARLDGELAGCGEGPSKKAAEQAAAREALRRIHEGGDENASPSSPKKKPPARGGRNR